MENTNNSTKNILIACIAFSILGIVSITAIDYEAGTMRVNISEINSKLAGENIVACGIVKSKSVSQSGTTFITLAEKNAEKSTGKNSKAQASKTMSLVFFKNEASQTESVSKGKNICARGTIQIYNGSAEIMGRKLV